MKTKQNLKTQFQGPDDFATVGKYVSSVRESKGFTLRTVVDLVKQLIKKGELEKQSALSRGYLSSLESDKYVHPSPFKLKALAHVYKIPYELLLNKAGYWDKTNKNIKEDASFTLMLKEVQEMTPGERESVLEYIEFVKSRRKQKI
jgi:transcriptional regulator with XRE-family HTH domain